MSKRHVVRAGEGMGSIAFQHGFSWRTLWGLPENAELRARRRPEFLQPGDVVHVPDLRRRQEPVATDTVHRFRRKDVPSRFAVRLLDEDGEPRADQAWTLEVHGEHFSGRTDAGGWIRVHVPPDARQGRLCLRGGRENYEIEFGRVEPIDSVRGAQAVLQNLGYYQAAVDGELSPATQDALAAFQGAADLPVTRELDAATVDALRRHYLG